MAAIQHLWANGKPSKKPPRGLTPAKIIRACEQRGAVLSVSYGGRRRRSYALNGAPVKEKYAIAAIRGGRLRSARDGLFGVTQSWVAQKPEDEGHHHQLRHAETRKRGPGRVSRKKGMAPGRHPDL